ncbi:alpha-glucoside-specific PTS transporter subunit IIBC [Dolosigranulum pigrum]|uniref:alpha-glucoside-specific PTS transporter subunit IIBC n=1 Tax=Dolosigranulum pigrum TaxID=29394 RepID=UPI000DC0032D|nr:alpha-glucoside-specific PTS transporter subunit IIBC [Dolosigranulum pigrum]QTJ49159.1 alpha-glucoside-specific phosphotransferase enzyme IIB component [Dolosigranulum pigrum]RAN59895.1 alpha-glucoside-specific phosphotransferase enzyme IIB component [Dolosigranulum pigrum]
MMQKIQRFGGAMITPVLLFAFNGIMLALSMAFQNEDILGAIAAEGTFWRNFWGVIEQGGWVVFTQLEILFVIGLPIGLAKKAAARASLAAFTVYMIWNTFINAIMSTWDFGIDISDVEAIGVKTIGGVATLDTNLIGAILISAFVVWLHNRFYDTELPDWLGIFSGTSFVVILGFFSALPLAYLTAVIWPPIQGVIASLQGVMASSGTVGVGIYVFLEKILIPTGLHHFIYQPFEFGPAIVEGGLQRYWFENLPEIAAHTGTLRSIIPAGGFLFQNAAKLFYPVGIGAAFLATSKPEKRRTVMALIVPTALTAMLTGITEPFEFTFLFLAPQLFFVHALLSASLAMTIYSLGVAGHIGGGLIAHISGFVIPLINNHLNSILIYWGVGLVFVAIYFFIFRWAILKFDIKTPGREDDDQDVKMFSKQDYKDKKASSSAAASSGSSSGGNAAEQKATGFLEAMGGPDNIADINNCTTRLRISVKDPDKLADDATFKSHGAHGVVRNGQAIQVIVGLDVPKVRDAFESRVNND